MIDHKTGVTIRQIRSASVCLSLAVCIFSLTSILTQSTSSAQTDDHQNVRPAPKGHYDEVFFKSKDENGRLIDVVRPQYRDIVEVSKDFSEARLKRAEKSTVADFGGDNALSLMPRIFVDAEYDGYLKPGVDQRGRALRDFLIDFRKSGGRPEIANAGIFPQAVLDQIVRRSSDSPYVGIRNNSDVTFLYGPDIIRDEQGRFRVLEDNTGYLGGWGDLKIALESLYKNVPEYPKLHEREPVEFYQKLVKRYKARAKPSAGKIVMLKTSTAGEEESERQSEAMLREGVAQVTSYSKAKVEFDHDGAWYRSAVGARRQKIGFLILMEDPVYLDPTHPITRIEHLYEYFGLIYSDLIKDLRESKKTRSSLGDEQRKFLELMEIRDEATGLPDLDALWNSISESGHQKHIRRARSTAFKGLIQAMLDGLVATNYSLGANFINDKEFYTYVEDIIRFYLKEEPILRNIKTFDPRIRKSNGEYGGLNLKLLDEVESNQSKYVIKIVNGLGGDGVWVGAKISKAKFKKGLEEVKRRPELFKIQLYTPLSVVSREITDLRIHSDVPPRGSVFVSDTGWSRALPLNGDGRVNLSSHGRESTVIVRSAAPFCEMLFSTTPASAIYRAR